jgi:hypothetical protein
MSTIVNIMISQYAAVLHELWSSALIRMSLSELTATYKGFFEVFEHQYLWEWVLPVRLL